MEGYAGVFLYITLLIAGFNLLVFLVTHMPL